MLLPFARGLGWGRGKTITNSAKSVYNVSSALAISLLSTLYIHTKTYMELKSWGSESRKPASIDINCSEKYKKDKVLLNSFIEFMSKTRKALS